MEEQPLAGGVANAGLVTRAGDHVLRPANARSPAIHRFLRALRDAGFDGASLPVAIEDGRERLGYVAGDVPLPPYPDWAQADGALASVAALLRRFHAAAAAFDPRGTAWAADLADPAGGTVLCHNDVCLPNVVFRDGAAVALLDFDFAAPGRPLYDLARLATMCVPLDDDDSAGRLGWHPADRAARLRLAADAYGLDAAGRAELLPILDTIMASGGEFVRRRAEAGEPGFVAMWAEMGGADRYDRRRRWWAESRARFAAALGAT